MKRILAIILAAVMLTLALTACSSNTESPTNAPDAATQAPADNATAAPADDQSGDAAQPASAAVTVGIVDRHQGSYPSSTISNEFISQLMIYDKLFEIDDNTGEFTSRVCEYWGWEDDNVTFKLKLKDGITFSDGTQVTGEDLLFSLEDFVVMGQSTDKEPYYKYIDFDKSYVEDDGLTVYIVYQMEFGPALYTLDVCILSKAFTEAHDESDLIWFTGPVGSGPYMITDCVQDSYVTFTLRDDYWNKDYSYDATEITLRFYTDETAMYIDYQNGTLDVIYNISTIIAEQVEAAGNQGTVKYTSNNDVTMINLYGSNQYLSDIEVRKAIAHALDMNAILEMAYGNLAKPATSHLASNFDAYVENEGYSYDPEYSKQILADAGYSAGEIVLDFVAVNFDPQPQIAETVQGYLANVGITVNAMSYDIGTALGMYFEGESDMACFAVNGGNPMREPYKMYSGLAEHSPMLPMAILDPEFNALIVEGQNSIDMEVRNKAYSAADQWLYDNYFAIPVAETLSAYAYNDRISEFNQGAINKSCLGSLKLK